MPAMPAHEVIVPLNARALPRDAFARPMRDLRISVMDRCNFRCPYCMPRETFHEEYRFLRSQERLSFEEIVRLARLFVQLKPRSQRGVSADQFIQRIRPEQQLMVVRSGPVSYYAGVIQLVVVRFAKTDGKRLQRFQRARRGDGNHSA